MRVFEPVCPFVDGTTVPRRVRRWIWTRGHRLRVQYVDNTTSLSDYRTLRELKRGEQVREVTP